MSLGTWLLSLVGLVDEAPRADPAWRPTGLRFTTSREYLQGKAEAGYRRSRLQTPRGRKFTRPKLAAPRPAADVVPFHVRRDRRGVK